MRKRKVPEASWDEHVIIALGIVLQFVIVAGIVLTNT